MRVTTVIVKPCSKIIYTFRFQLLERAYLWFLVLISHLEIGASWVTISSRNTIDLTYLPLEIATGPIPSKLSFVIGKWSFIASPRVPEESWHTWYQWHIRQEEANFLQKPGKFHFELWIFIKQDFRLGCTTFHFVSSLAFSYCIIICVACCFSLFTYSLDLLVVDGNIEAVDIDVSLLECKSMNGISIIKKKKIRSYISAEKYINYTIFSKQ